MALENGGGLLWLVVPVHDCAVQWWYFLSHSILDVKYEKQTKIMTFRSLKRTACLVIVVPGGADHVKLWRPQGFNLKIAACFTKVSILMFKGNRGRRNNLRSLVHKQPRIKHEIRDSSSPMCLLP